MRESISDRNNHPLFSLVDDFVLTEHFSLIISQVIENSIELAIKRKEIDDAHNYAKDLFEGTFESSISMINLYSRTPNEAFHRNFDSTMNSEIETATIMYENWSRGCIDINIPFSKNKKDSTRVGVSDSKANINILSVSQNGEKRLSARKSGTSFSKILSNLSVKNIISLKEEPIEMTKTNFHSRMRQPTTSFADSKIINISKLRSMSITNNKIEESLRYLKLSELASSEVGHANGPTSQKSNANQPLALKSNQKLIRNTLVSRHFEKTFGINGELQELKAVKHDRISSVIQYAK